MRSESSVASSSRWAFPACWACRYGTFWGRVRGGECGRSVSRRSAAPRTAKSVILVFLTGGLSHIDSFDMKPDAPDGIRGEFQPIATKVPGISICEHLPGLAARADQLAIVRSLSHAVTPTT